MDNLIISAVCMVAGGAVALSALVAAVLEWRRDREMDAEEGRLWDMFLSGDRRVFLDPEPFDFHADAVRYVNTESGRFLIGAELERRSRNLSWWADPH